jgi:hypothetical protein
MHSTRYFGEEDWEGSGQPYKPTHTYIWKEIEKSPDVL